MNHILIYQFYDAPEELQQLSEHGGDEEWIIIIPNTILNKHHGYISMFEQKFIDNQEVEHENYPDCTIYISAH